MKNIFFVAIGAMGLLAACDNKEETPVAYEITFTVVEPEEAMMVLSGEEVHMEVDIDGTKAIGNAEMLVINETTGDTLYSYQTATAESFLQLHEHFDIVVAAAADCMFMVSAWESNYADRVSEHVHFQAMP